MTTHRLTDPTVSLDADGLRIAVTHDGRDAWNGAHAYTWRAYDLGADDPTQPFASSSFTTTRSRPLDLAAALRTAVEFCAAGSPYSGQPAELRSINPETWGRMFTALAMDIPDALADRIAHVTGVAR